MRYQCTACKQSADSLTSRCVWCERIGTVEETADRGRTNPYVDDDDDDGDRRPRKLEAPVKMSKIEAEDVVRIKTGIREVDKLLGGGLVRGCVYVLIGPPGAGKSTLVLELIKASNVASALYVNGEEAGDKIKSRVKRLKMPSGRILCWPHKMRDFDTAMSVDIAPDIAVYDSLQSMTVEGVRDRNEKLRMIVEAALDFAEETDSVGIIISRVNKSGALSGTNDVEHEGDGTLEIRFAGLDDEDPKRIIRVTKHRHGPAPRSIGADLGEVGFTFYELKKTQKTNELDQRIETSSPLRAVD